MDSIGMSGAKRLNENPPWDDSAELDNDSAMLSEGNVAALAAHETPEAQKPMRFMSPESSNSKDNAVVKASASRRILGRSPSSDEVDSYNELPPRHEEEEREVAPLPYLEMLRGIFNNIPIGDEDDPGTPSSYHSSEISSNPTTPERHQAPVIEVDEAVYRQPEREAVMSPVGPEAVSDDNGGVEASESRRLLDMQQDFYEADDELLPRHDEEEDEVVPLPDMELLREFFNNIPVDDDDDPGIPSSHHSSEVSSDPTTPKRPEDTHDSGTSSENVI